MNSSSQRVEVLVFLIAPAFTVVDLVRFGRKARPHDAVLLPHERRRLRLLLVKCEAGRGTCASHGITAGTCDFLLSISLGRHELFLPIHYSAMYHGSSRRGALWTAQFCCVGSWPDILKALVLFLFKTAIASHNNLMCALNASRLRNAGMVAVASTTEGT